MSEQQPCPQAAADTAVVVTAELGERIHPITDRRLIYLAAAPTEDTAMQALDAAITELRWASLADLDQLLPDLFAPVRRWLAHLDAGAEPAQPRTRGCRG